MKEILIRFVNDRGNETRISTNSAPMSLDVFFNVNGEIKRASVDLSIKDGQLQVLAQGKGVGEVWGCVDGKDARKLGVK